MNERNPEAMPRMAREHDQVQATYQWVCSLCARRVDAAVPITEPLRCPTCGGTTRLEEAD